MNKVLKIVTALPALLFIFVGLRWLLAPAGVAAEFGMPLLDGLGGSTQIGDIGAFFLGSGLMVLIGLATEKREWLYAATLLVGGAAVFRTAAWLLHDMPFAVPQVGIEVAMTALLLFTASRMKDQ
jgi:hypothetical protein